MEQSNHKAFHHPYKPYDIQIDLMKAIYECIENGNIGIFESPTGTGKSLSLICSSLTWLREFQEKSDLATTEEDDDEPAWVREHARKQRKQAVVETRAKMEARLRQTRKKLKQTKLQAQDNEVPAKKMKLDMLADLDGDAQFELHEYVSDDDKGKSSGKNPEADPGVSSTNLQLMEKLGLAYKAPEDDDVSTVDAVKIFFCSRTHSQLIQFARELQRVDLPPSNYIEQVNGSHGSVNETGVVKHVPLGSRKNLCINAKVATLKNTVAINDKCLELQQTETPKDQRCAFLPKQENDSTLQDFRDLTLATVQDIEDVQALGKGLGICPYYASRVAIKPSEMVTLPYPLLLQKSAREALDLSLKGHVIIIDEAHNLMDTISSIHSVSVSLTQLKNCRASLGAYLQKFRNRLKGKNRVYVAQLVRLIDSLSGHLNTKADAKTGSDGTVNVSDLVSGKGADQVNMNKLQHYLQQSKLSRKVEGYMQRREQSNHPEQNSLRIRLRDHSSTSSMMKVEAFLLALTNTAAEGRFFYEKGDNDDLLLKYMLLDPAFHFKEIVEEARAVILAGGTMSPMDDYARDLFPYLPQERITTWSCGHIIPKENLIVMPVGYHSSKTAFDFNFEARNAPKLLSALGDSLIRLSSCIPDGIVVFFPSYAYLDKVVAFFKSEQHVSSSRQTIWDCLQACKPIFVERKNNPVDETLSSYSVSVSTSKGGLLLAVIGGKLSEGINFSDALGRGVIVVGLPFPNIQSAQWQAKLEYIEQSTTKRTGSTTEAKKARQDCYENACMRAVNQSIGRAIRHRNDYAAIVLLDRRYGRKNIEAKLPGWIRQGLCRESLGFESSLANVQAFFDTQRSRYDE